ncbi:MAG: YfbM family protein [Methanosarcinales archaeon]|jgi:hypothetical protein|nr:YfbM family protein [Methanosarcinales archaeon]
MILIFAAVSEQQIRNFENGNIDKNQFIDVLVNADRIGLSQIDRAANVLANDDEFSEYYEIIGAGEILAGGDGEALVIDPISFEDEDGSGFIVADPAVYMTNDEIKEAVGILESVDKEQFKDAFDFKMKKLTKRSFLSKKKQALKESAPEIFEMLWDEIEALRVFYQKASVGGNYAVVFSMYEDEDFE